VTLDLADLDGFASVIVTSADVTGRPVGKRVSVEVFRRIVHEGIPLSSCVLGWDVDQWPGPAQEYTGNHTGWHDVRLVPDLGTLRPAAWLERAAICVADFVEMGSDELAPVAPRTILRRQIEHLAATGLTAQVASELEFALYHGSYEEGRANGYETLGPTTLARADYTIQAGDRYEGFFSGVRDALTASELGPWTSQVEWGLGQWEINLEYRQALEMADRHLLFKLAMRVHGAAAFAEAIERNLAQAQLLYDAVSTRDDFEALAPPKLSIVAFRHAPAGVADKCSHNPRLTEAIQADRRVRFSSALIDDEVWLRPCFVNFRTTEEDVLDVVEIAAEIGERLAAG
jgi:glutamine synthetase